MRFFSKLYFWSRWTQFLKKLMHRSFLPQFLNLQDSIFDRAKDGSTCSFSELFHLVLFGVLLSFVIGKNVQKLITKKCLINEHQQQIVWNLRNQSIIEISFSSIWDNGTVSQVVNPTTPNAQRPNTSLAKMGLLKLSILLSIQCK